MLRRLLIHLAFLVVAGGNISAKAQDATKFEVVPIIGHAGSISTIEYSVDGRFALTGSWDSTLKLWEIVTGRLLRTLEGHEPFGIRGYSYVTAISFSRDGQLAVSSGVDRTIRTWDLVHGQLLRTIPAHRGEPKAVSVSDDGQFIVSGSDVPDDPSTVASVQEGTLKLWNAATGEMIHSFGGYNEPINDVTFSADGKLLISSGPSSSDDGIKVWDLESGHLIRTLPASGGDARKARFLSDGQSVVSLVQYDSGTFIREWDSRSGALLQNQLIQNSYVQLLAASSSGQFAIFRNTNNDQTLLELLEISNTGLKRRPIAFGLKLVAALSPNANSMMSTSNPDETLEFWDTASATLVRQVKALASTDGFFVSSSGDGWLLTSIQYGTPVLWNYKTPELKVIKTAPVSAFGIVRFAKDTLILSAQALNDSGELFTDAHFVDLVSGTEPIVLESGEEILGFDDNEHPTRLATFSKTVSEVRLWDLHSKSVIRRISIPPNADRISGSVTVSSQLKWLAYTTTGAAEIMDINSQTKLQIRPTANNDPYTLIAFSDTGQNFAAASKSGKITVRASTDGKSLSQLPISRHDIRKIKFANNDRLLVIEAGSGGTTGRTTYIADIRTKKSESLFSCYKTCGHVLQYLGADFLLKSSFPINKFHRLTKQFTISRWASGGFKDVFSATTTEPSGISLSPTGDIFAVPDGRRIALLNASSGVHVGELRGHLGSVRATAFTPDGRTLISGGDDGTVRLWNVSTGDLLITLIAGNDGEWLAITPEGIFAASHDGSRASDYVSVVRGLRTYSVFQFFDQLYFPELVKELLHGDVQRIYRDTAKDIELQKVIDSGPPPQIDVLENQSDTANASVSIAVRIFNNLGGGIGTKLIWRVNGVVQGETTASELRELRDPQGPVVVSRGLRVNPYEKNIVTVTAYNEKDLWATEPKEITVDKFGISTTPPAKMYVLGIAVDEYPLEPSLKKLQFAEKDVRALGNALYVSGKNGGYEDVKIVDMLVNENAVREKIADAFARAGAQIAPWDTFILVIAGHGRSVAGRGYFFYPQNTSFGNGRNVFTEGIGTDQWRDWLAKVETTKRLLIIDTCESSEAIAIERGSSDERKSAIDRIREAIGHSVITAARQIAYEGSAYGHGILSYAILEALGTPAIGSPDIDVKGIDNFVVSEVPKISLRLSGVEQKPYDKIVGNFIIGRPESSVQPMKPPTCAATPGEYAFLHRESIRQSPSVDGNVNWIEDAGYRVNVAEFLDGWDKICREGIEIGYVPSNALLRLR